MSMTLIAQPAAPRSSDVRGDSDWYDKKDWLAQPKLSESLDKQQMSAFAAGAAMAGQPSPAFVSEGWRPHRDSNPGFSLERAAS